MQIPTKRQTYRVAYYGESFQLTEEEMARFEAALMAGKSIVKVGNKILTDKFLYIIPLYPERYIELYNKPDRTDNEEREYLALAERIR